MNTASSSSHQALESPAFRHGEDVKGPDQFHIFDDPAVVVVVGSPDSPVIPVLQAANARSVFTREVGVYVDDAWQQAKP